MLGSIIPVGMTTFNTSCPDHFAQRLKERFKEGRSRSAWIVKVLSEELDILDSKDIEDKLHEKIIKETLPELKGLLKEYDFHDLLELWSGKQERRDLLNAKLSKRLNDEDFKKALDMVLRKMER